MKFFQSLRWRQQLWHGLLLALVLAGFGFTAWRLQRTNQLRRIDQALEERISVVAGGIRRGGGAPGRPPQDRPPRDHPPPADRLEAGPPPPARQEVRLSERELSLFEGNPGSAFYYIAWLPGGREICRSASAPSDVPRPERVAGPRDSRSRGAVRECFHFTPTGECVLVGRELRNDLADMRHFAWLLAAAGGLVLLLGLAGGWWISTRAIRPIADISAAAVRISTGDLTQRIHTTDTDSELGDLARVLNDTFARLQASFARQAQFTADASHELRTPVSVVLTQTQTALARERSGAEYRESLAACQRAARRMHRLIECLLELARLDAGQESFQRERFDLARAAQEGLELVRPLAAERHITIHSELPVTECFGDAERLGQVITNLLTNAILHNHPGGEVQVTARREASLALLEVADNGPGIPAEDLPHIFERFYCADKSRSGSTGVAGLGLAISKAIVEAHGGTIEVTSESEAGTRFAIRLPVDAGKG
jgi:two-component system OmpR family sensor kinase